MIPTIQFIKINFERFNRDIFGNMLPDVVFKIGRSSKYVGLFSVKKQRNCFREERILEVAISLSRQFNLPEREWEDTLIHEMIHLWIFHFKLKDTSVHGKIFREKMDEINRIHSRNISLKHHGSEDSETEILQKARNNYFCISRLKNGEPAITVCAKTKIFEIHRTLSAASNIVSIAWYWSCNPWFSKFPLSRTPKLYRISEEELDKYVANAILCICDSKSFRPANLR